MRFDIPTLLRLAATVSAGLSIMTASTPSQAQDGAIAAVTYLDLSPASAAASRSKLAAYRDAIRKRGAEVAEVYQDIARPGRFAVREVWKDIAALQANASAEPAQTLAKDLEPAQLAPADQRQHDGYSLGKGPASASADAVYVFTHVDVTPPMLAGLEPILKEVATASRKDAGSIRFDVLQQTNRKNHFTVFEGWASAAAFEAHAAGPAARDFRGKLGPMLGALYDQRLYKLVD